MVDLAEIISSFDLIAFGVLAALSLIGALMVVISKEVVHSVVYLALSFLSIAGIFILLNAEFLGVIQILVFVGAITAVILFAIMLTRRQIMNDRGGEES